MTTTTIGSALRLFAGDMTASWGQEIARILEGDAQAYDIPAIVSEWLAKIEDLLPKTWSISGDELIAECDDHMVLLEGLDDEGMEALTELVDEIDLWEIIEKHPATTPVAVDVVEDAPREWPSNWTGFCTQDEALRITKRDEAGALALTGKLGGPTLLTRLAYIGHATSAKTRAVLTTRLDKADPAEWRGMVKAEFVEAYQVARARWEDERDSLLAGTRIAGPVLRAIREVMRLTPEEMAHQVGVRTDTLLGWETEKPVINAGASADVWRIWATWVAEVRALMGAYDVPTLPAETPKNVIRAALLLNDGKPVALHPGPVTVHGWMEEA